MRFLILLPLLAGILNAFQGGINGTLGKRIGVFEASLMNFLYYCRADDDECCHRQL
ncbi:DMT family transporter [Alicyclobacillus sp. SO9]|uniref:DMT family transporter n=1 Tax=Alicyclobacillus sp. SO9 TaxID=2665646 RepID=UPI0018E81F77|nr:DMT family transporter [Alicyclobacillus sp. SO9]QQE79838.1 DMT family transporter [Alicyclobacillus sp. SO9]